MLNDRDQFPVRSFFVYVLAGSMGMGNMRPLSFQLVVKPTTHSQLVLGLIISGAVSSPSYKLSWRVTCLKRTGTASVL